VVEHSNTSSLVFVVDGLVLTGSDQDLKAFKDSRTSICITCGVAVCSQDCIVYVIVADLS
jgi:hypothetical protein